MSRIYTGDEELLSEWLLLSNVHEAESSEIALWYYWRWKIESFFKLLKSAGHHLESWQQDSGLAIAKRLLVTSMACVTVWEIAANKSSEANALRSFLIKLSGRQIEKKKIFTHPALLAGLWVFLSMLGVMETYSQTEIQQFKETTQKVIRSLM